MTKGLLLTFIIFGSFLAWGLWPRAHSIHDDLVRYECYEQIDDWVLIKRSDLCLSIAYPDKP